MRRTSLCLVTLLLMAVPLLAQSLSTPACGAKASFSVKGLEGLTAYQPLAPEQRFFYGLAGLDRDAPLEVRYFVKGDLYLTETVDLATARLPQVDNRPKSLLKSKTAIERESLFEEERMIELLALRPDLVRQLRDLAEKAAKDDTLIRIELHQEGRLVESLAFEELAQRSSELGSSRTVPLVVHSTVSGPGDLGGEKIRSVAAFDYLESCSDCTSEMPCNTECGWDPGKGGPVTCGEQGQPCYDNTPCACSTLYSDSWTGWYVYNSYFTSQTACLRSFTSPTGSAVHQVYVQQLRRDRVQRSFVCPNCPACTNCYTQEQVVQYQLTSTSCWQELPPLCSGGSTPCCSSLCTVGPLTICYSGC